LPTWDIGQSEKRLTGSTTKKVTSQVIVDGPQQKNKEPISETRFSRSTGPHDVYRVKNWRQFQHYKDRNPPWIKLHFSILSSRDWVTLDDASRVLAVACMLIASRNDGLIHSDAAGLEYLQRVAYLKRKPDLKPLIECGFLESASTDASKTLANARPETETEDLKQKETPIAPDAARRPPKANGRLIEFDPVKGTFKGITEEQELAWQDAYPAVPIPPEIARAAAWAKANPANRKSNWHKFLVNWFGRAQDRAPRLA
jgi:hypothetical protein